MAAPAADPFDLQRFIDAQAPVWDSVQAELAAGAKRSHWMWFVFPQLRGLGHSAMAWRYGITGLDEAQAYAAHPLLGERLVAATQQVLRHAGRDVRAIFAPPDDLKFRSCMTLFARACPGLPVFAQALAAFHEGLGDPRTVALLAAHGAPGRGG